MDLLKRIEANIRKQSIKRARRYQRPPHVQQSHAKLRKQVRSDLRRPALDVEQLIRIDQTGES